MLTITWVAGAALALGVLAGRFWWCMAHRPWDESRAVVWLLDRDGSAIPTRLHATDPDEARVLVESLGAGAAVGLGLRFTDGRVVRHHFGRELPLEACDQLSIPVPRAFLPQRAA